jgi:CheY-like chemotaxis protein
MQKQILVIDDDSAVRLAFELALEDSGYNVITAASGEGGIDILKKSNFNLIFLDLKMPGMNGIETLRGIRKINNDIPVYIVTAFFGEYFSDLKQLEEEGIHFEVLKKPISGDYILLLTRSIFEGPVEFS